MLPDPARPWRVLAEEVTVLEGQGTAPLSAHRAGTGERSLPMALVRGRPIFTPNQLLPSRREYGFTIHKAKFIEPGLRCRARVAGRVVKSLQHPA